jgi:hypothetical protein
VYTKREIELEEKNNFNEYSNEPQVLIPSKCNRIEWSLWYHEGFYVLEDPKTGLHTLKIFLNDQKVLSRSVDRLYCQLDFQPKETKKDPYNLASKILFEIQTHQKAIKDYSKKVEALSLPNDLTEKIMEFVGIDSVQESPYFWNFGDESYELSSRCSFSFQSEWFTFIERFTEEERERDPFADPFVSGEYEWCGETIEFVDFGWNGRRKTHLPEETVRTNVDRTTGTCTMSINVVRNQPFFK